MFRDKKEAAFIKLSKTKIRRLKEKNMKKFLTLLVAAILCFTCVSLFACNKPKSEPVVKVLEVELTNEQYAIAVNKSNTTLLNEINAAMRQLKQDGTYETIYAKYTSDSYAENEGSYAMHVLTGDDISLENLNPATHFAIATSADFPPFENKLGAKYVGLDIEFANEIAIMMGKTLVVYNMSFDAAEIFPQTNPNVVAMAGLTVNEDRLSKMNFTDSYIDATQVLIVKINDTTFDEILNSQVTASEKAEQIIAKINSLNAPKIGAQNGTTGYNFAKGNEAFGYAGFDADTIVRGYTTGTLAVQDLANGNIDMVILDKLPAQQISRNINK